MYSQVLCCWEWTVIISFHHQKVLKNTDLYGLLYPLCEEEVIPDFIIMLHARGFRLFFHQKMFI